MSAWNKFVSESFGFSDLPKTEQRKRRNSLELGLFILVAGTAFNLAYAYLLFPEMNYVSMASIATIVALIAYYYFSKNYIVYRTALLLIVVFFGILAQISVGGFVDGSGVVFCTILPALGALIFADFITARIFFFLFVLACIIAGVWEYFYFQENFIVPRNVSISFFVINFISIGAIIFFLIESFYKKMNSFQQEVEVEKGKSEKLLKNILPSSIAQELKETGESKAKGFASATVIFSDIVGFSEISMFLTPGELVSQLDLYFRAFDDIMEKYGLEKIKTIGDAYLAVSGIPTETFVHAEKAIDAALEMQEVVSKINKSEKVNEPIKLRIGIHSGPLVAGVVGKKKFTYDIWGETVNIAARMEQNADPGSINISKSTYNLIFKRFQCTSRGKISAKNMEDLDMYFVNKKMSLKNA